MKAVISGQYGLSIETVSSWCDRPHLDHSVGVRVGGGCMGESRLIGVGQIGACEREFRVSVETAPCFGLETSSPSPRAFGQPECLPVSAQAPPPWRHRRGPAVHARARRAALRLSLLHDRRLFQAR